MCLRVVVLWLFFFGCGVGVVWVWVWVWVSDGCKEEEGKERGVGLKYPWVNVTVLWYCVMVSPKL